jgi:HEAT repeat protein
LFALLVVAVVGPATMAAAQEETLEQLRRDLASGDPDVRADAVRQLGEWGPAARDAVPEITQALRSDDPALRYAALVALGNIGPDAKPSVDQIRPLLTDAAPLLRYAALNALRQIADQSVEVREALVKRMQTDDLLTNRIAAARALAELAARDDEQTASPDVIAALIEGLRSPEMFIASDATHGLAAVGAGAAEPILNLFQSGSVPEQINATHALVMVGLSADAAGPALLKALTDCEEPLKRHIIRALPAVGADPQAAVQALQRELGADSRELRLSAIAALGEFGAAAAPAVSDLADQLSDADLLIQRTAAAALGKLGPAAAPAVSRLVAALRDDDGAVTVEAAQALGMIGPAAVPPLIALLEDPQYRVLAATVLGDIGPSAVGAVPALLKILGLPDEDTGRAALLALASIGPVARPLAAQPLLGLLREGRGNARAGAAYALARIEVEEAVPELRRLLQDTNDPRERLAAAWALVMLQPDAERSVEAVPILIEGLSDEWELVRKECVIALGALGPRAKSASEKLMSLLNDPDPLVRAEAAVTLHRVGTTAQTLVPVLIKGLEDDAPHVRFASAYVLGMIGQEAESAVLQLKGMMNHHEELDRTLAAWALLKIAPTEQTLQQAVPHMLQALSHPRPRIRCEAATVLGELGGTQPAIRDALQNACTDDDATVREAAQAALKNLSTD